MALDMRAQPEPQLFADYRREKKCKLLPAHKVKRECDIGCDIAILRYTMQNRDNYSLIERGERIILQSRSMPTRSGGEV